MRTISKEQESAIIAQVLGGNTNAFQKLVNEYQHYVFTIVNRVLEHQEDSEDVAQEVFVKAYRYLEKFDGRSKFSTWLYRIAMNTAITHRRKQKFYTADVEKNAGHMAVEQSNSVKLNEQKKFIQQAFSYLSEDDVTILTLFYLQELQLTEIAEILELQPNNVKVKLFRARKRLAEKLQLILKDEVKTIL